MYHDERIDYSNYLKNKEMETDPIRIAGMRTIIEQALSDAGIRRKFDATYYTDGTAAVRIGGKIPCMFDAKTGEFFFGYVGDYQKGDADT